MESPLDHVFVNYQVNIVQSCDQCTSYIWGMEKAYMCSCELMAQQNSLLVDRFSTYRVCPYDICNVKKQKRQLQCQTCF